MVAFKIKYNVGTTHESLETPPVLLTPKTEKRKDILLTIKDGATGKFNEKQLTWPEGVDPELLRRFLDESKNGDDQANVSVNVAATENE
jgi:hypothetical protein